MDDSLHIFGTFVVGFATSPRRSASHWQVLLDLAARQAIGKALSEAQSSSFHQRSQPTKLPAAHELRGNPGLHFDSSNSSKNKRNNKLNCTRIIFTCQHCPTFLAKSHRSLQSPVRGAKKQTVRKRRRAAIFLFLISFQAQS